MPSVDQTALATLSAKSLGWDYRGTLFEFSLIDTIAPYIDLHGDAFRSVEHSILSSVLSVEPTETVTACRGCTTELSENGEMLKSLGGVVVGVMREVECVFKCLCTASQIPSYIRETAEVAWEKKKAYFSTPCSSSISHPPPFVRSGIQTGASSSNTSKKTIPGYRGSHMDFARTMLLFPTLRPPPPLTAPIRTRYKPALRRLPRCRPSAPRN